MSIAKAEIESPGLQPPSALALQLASTQCPYPTVRLCVHSCTLRADNTSVLQAGSSSSQLNAGHIKSVWVSFTSNIRWIPMNAERNAPSTLLDFRHAQCLILSRLPKHSTWDDVNQHVRIQQSNDGNYLIVRGKLQSRLLSRQVQVAILGSEGHQLNCAELRNMVYLRIAPWELLFSAMLTGKQALPHDYQIGILHTQLMELSFSAELDVLDDDIPRSAKTARLGNTSASSKISCTAVKTLMDYLQVGSLIAERMIRYFGDVSDATEGVPIVRAFFHMMTVGVQTAVLVRETRNGGKAYPSILSSILYLFRELTKITGIRLCSSANRENAFDLLVRTMQLLAKVEQLLMKCRLVRRLAGYDVKEAPAGIGVLNRSTFRTIGNRETDVKQKKPEEEELVEELQMCPPLCDYFSGRTDELEDLLRELEGQGKALITQYGGSGKTQLMILLVDEIEKYDVAPGGVYWITVDGNELQILAAFVSFIEAMTCKNMKSEDRLDRSKVLCELENVLDNCIGRWVLCLDNADDPSGNGIIGDVCKLTSPLRGWVVVTSRQDARSLSSVFVDKKQIVQVPPLSEKMSMIVLWRWKLRKCRKEITDEEVYADLKSNEGEYCAMRRVVNNLDLDGLPLALSNIGSRILLTDLTFEEYARYTENKESHESLKVILYPNMEMWGQIRNEQEGIWSTWKTSVERVDDDAKEVLNVIALYARSKIPGELVGRVITSIVGGNGKANRGILKFVKHQLVHETSLVQVGDESEEGSLSIHPLIRRFTLSDLLERVEAFRKTVYIGVRALHECVEVHMQKYGSDMHDPPLNADEYTEVLLEHAHSIVRLSWAVPFFNQHALRRKEKFRWLVKRRKRQDDGTLTNENDRNLDSLHFFVMHTLHHQCKWNEALETGYRLLARYNSRHGSEADVGGKSATLQTVGRVLRDQGKLEEAEKVLENCIEMKRRLLGSGVDDLNLSVALSDLATVKESKRSLNEAGEVYRESLAMLHRLLGKEADHKLISMTMSRLAVVQSRQGHFVEAEEMLGKCLQMQLRLYGEGKASHDVSISMNKMAQVKRDQGKLADAELLLRESITMKRKVFGESTVNIHIAAALKNLGCVLILQGSLEDAEKTLSECIKMYELLLGEHSDHQDLTQARNGLEELVSSRR